MSTSVHIPLINITNVSNSTPMVNNDPITSASNMLSVLLFTMPSLASNGARSQAVSSLLDEIANGNCDPLNDNEGKPSYSESPLQINLANGGYDAGKLIGNPVFILILCVLVFILRFIVSHYRKINETIE